MNKKPITPFKLKTANDGNVPVSGSLAKQEALKELLDYIDSFHGSGHDYWWINSKIRDKVYWMLERSKANDR